MTYKISVIMVAFNTEKFIEEALDSIVNQSIGIDNIEVIMINDCSNDKTGEIINNYSNIYKNFTSVHLPENTGTPGYPRNIGIEKASGEYLMFLDSDDIYATDVCEILYNKIKKENLDIVFNKYILFSEGFKRKVNYKNLDFDSEVKINTIEENPGLLNTPPSLWTKIFKRKFIIENDIRFPENVLAEDMVFVLDAFFKANGILFLNNYYGYNYRVFLDDSLSRKKNLKNLMGMVNGYIESYNLLKNHGNTETFFPIIFTSHLEFWADGFIISDTTTKEKKELLKKIQPLFKELNNYDITIKNYLVPLFNRISFEDYDEAILIAEIISNFQKREKSLENQLKTKENTIQNVNMELKKSKIRIAELQRLSGYWDYKTKNIINRLKNKIG